MPDDILEKLELTEEQKAEGGQLTEEQEQKIQDSIEWGEEDVKKKPEGEPEAKEEDETPSEEVEENSEEESGLTEAEQKVEDERLSKKSEELGKTVDEVRELEVKEAEAEQTEQDRIAKEAEEQGKTVEEVVASEKAEADKVETDRVEAIAKEEGLSVDEVKENEQKDQALIERHGSDPQKLARAFRKMQSESDKNKSEFEKLKAADVKQSELINEQEFHAKCEGQREKIVAEYRRAFPEKSEPLEDDVCFDLGKAAVKASWDKAVAEEAEQIKTEATEARKSHLDKLSPELNKEFRSEVSELLEKCSDNQILNPQFDVESIAFLCRGKKYSPEYVKNLEKEAFNRGAEEKKILGAKRGPQGSGAKPPVKGKGEVRTSLSDSQKQRAEEMYEGTNMSKQKMYDEYEKIKDQDF